jgi:hypothetical protein
MVGFRGTGAENDRLFGCGAGSPRYQNFKTSSLLLAKGIMQQIEDTP